MPKAAAGSSKQNSRGCSIQESFACVRQIYSVLCWWKMLLLLFLTAVAAEQWPCPYSCWSLPSSPNLPASYSGLWDCTPCKCGYGNTVNEGGDCYQCANPFSDTVPIPTTLTDCNDRSQYTCQQGYYGPSCNLPCRPPPNCGYGYYSEHCPNGCRPCSNPIPNPASQAYGPQAGRAPCTTSFDGSCALYLTPSWDAYACLIYCGIGYANVEEDPLSEIPHCLPCEDVCELGFACPYINIEYRQCVACSALNANQQLPQNASWLPHCQWECNQGFYNEPDTAVCTPCDPSQLCFNQSHSFLGCYGTSPGQCTPMDASACVAGSTFLYFQVYSHSAVCRPCALPTPNTTFTVDACTQLADTKLEACSVCPLGSYLVTHCTLTADIQCAPCSTGASGLLMLQACTPTADALFGPCPPGKFCDGSLNLLDCPHPKIAQDGLCVCPPAMVPLLSGCKPIVCPQGSYPNATTSDCTPCGTTMALTLPDVIGALACVCPPEHFIERSGDTMDCWPCGDLACFPGLQLQTPCTGLTSAEPDCECLVPPGAQVPLCLPSLSIRP